MAAVYSTTVKVDGGRQGHARSDDGKLELELSVPQELGGGEGAGTNPEQLFAAGYAACFQSALLHTAEQRGLTVTNSSITSTVELSPDGSGLGLSVVLDVSLPGVSKDDAEEIVELVHSSVCPYSKALRNNVDVDIRVV